MARVPVYNSLQVAANTLAPARIAAPAMPTVAGQDTQQIGAAMQKFGDQVGRVALDMAAQANQLRIDDALNKAKEAALNLTYDQSEGFSSLKGASALDRPDGKPLADEYGDKLQKQFADIAGTLGNDTQRTAFALHANDILVSFRGQAIRHETGEFQTYALSTSEGIQSTALRDIGLNWNDPGAVMSAVERIRAETYRQAQLLGKSAEWQEAHARKLTSNAHKVALLAAIEQNDPGYADGYLRKFSGQMDADDILTVRGHIMREMNTRVGFGAALDAVGNTHVEVSEGERAFNIAVNAESGGRQFDVDGGPLTSAKGAIGIAQIMPDTGPEAAKLAGLSWDESRYRNDPDYNRALGMAYFQKQLRDNGGDLAKAYAAYNAGPGALKDAVQKAREGGNWLAELPKETQDYVAKNIAAFQAGRGKPERPTFADIDARLRADHRLADNPVRYKVAREEASRLFKDQADAIKQRDDEAEAEALRSLIANGGRFADLPAAVRMAVPADRYTNLMGAAERIAKGTAVHDPQTWAQVMSLSESELAAMTTLDFFNKYRAYLDDIHLEKGQALVAAARGDVGKDPKQLAVVSTAGALKQAARGAGILPWVGQADEKQAQHFAIFENSVQQRVREYEATTLGGKRAASRDELEQVIDGVLLDTVKVSEWGGDPIFPVGALMSDQMKDAYVTVGGQDIPLGAIPAAQRLQITTALKDRGLPVTEQGIAEMWVRAGMPK